ncbi:hypothetical protein EJB05_39665, partial [Eragrostis curvula]
ESRDIALSSVLAVGRNPFPPLLALAFAGRRLLLTRRRLRSLEAKSFLLPESLARARRPCSAFVSLQLRRTTEELSAALSCIVDAYLDGLRCSSSNGNLQMARSEEHGADVDGDSSGDFVLPSRSGVARKKVASPFDGVKTRKKKVDVDGGGFNLNSSFSLNKIRNVLGSFVGQKKHLLESIGFGGLLLIHKQPKISRRLAFWLLRNMENPGISIVVRDGAKIQIKDADVNLVLGLPHQLDGTRQLLSISRAAEIVKATLGLGKQADIRMDYIESLLMKDYCGKMSIKEKLAFKVALVLFVDAYFLAPKSSPARVNYGLLPYLVDPDSIQGINWSAYLLKVVKEASIKVKHAISRGNKNVSLDCCLIFLEVFYLDNLETGSNDGSNRKLPRVTEFPYEKIKNILAEDTETSKDGNSMYFGKLKASDQVVYSWGSNNIDSPQHNTGASREDAGEYVMSRFRDFKEQVDEYSRAYVDQIEGLCLNLEYSISEYIAAARSTENKDGGHSCSELTVSCVQADTAQDSKKNSPFSNMKQRQSPSVGICQKFEAIDLCTPDIKLLKTSEFCMNQSERSYGVYSGGPAFDQSAVRESGEFCQSLDGSYIMQSSTPDTEEEHVVSGGEGIHCKQFPESPFRLLLEDPIITKSAVLTLQQELEKLCEEDLERYWFVHKTPTNISLSGRMLREQFTCIAEWTIPVVDAISRLWMHLDDIMKLSYMGKRFVGWKKPMRCSGMLTSNTVLKTVICAPVQVEASWSCYVWDLKESVVTVIDPKRMVHDKEYVQFKHHLTVEKLNRGLATCLGSHGFEWTTNYLSVEGANCESWYSGLYSMFYSRVFDGRCLTQPVARDLIPFTRLKNLYQLLTMEENGGDLPFTRLTMSLQRI